MYTIYNFIFFIKFIFFINIFVVALSTFIVVGDKYIGNTAAIKERNITSFLKNILLVNLLFNIFIVALLFYILLLFYKKNSILLLLSTSRLNLFYQYSVFFFYSCEFDLFNFLFYTLALFVAFISLLALDTRLYSSKTIFFVLCNFLTLIIFMFSFTNNYILFFIFYELLLIPSFFFVYKISPAKTAVQSAIYFVM
jgi:formate hydrogenlyase subunit 3/multisubunit Na+/H+ antiporter MnhD subunit